MSKKDDKKVTVVAELEVTSPQGTTKVKSFDKAWQAAKGLPLPVHMKFVGFTRID